MGAAVGAVQGALIVVAPALACAAATGRWAGSVNTALLVVLTDISSISCLAAGWGVWLVAKNAARVEK